MRNGSNVWMRAGVAACGLLLFIAAFPGRMGTAGHAIALAFGAALAVFCAAGRCCAAPLREGQEEEEKRLAASLDHIPTALGIYVFEDGTLKRSYMNQGYYDMLGMGEDARAMGKGFARSVHPDDLPTIMAKMQKDIMAGREFEGSFRVLDGTGEYRWLKLRVRPVERVGNKRICYGAFFDNESLVRVHRALRESQMMMQTALTHSGLQAWSYDPATRRAREIAVVYGDGQDDYGVEDYPNAMLKRGFIHPEDAEVYRDLHRRVEEGENEAEAEVRSRGPGGSWRWERIRYTRLRDTNGRVFTVLGTSADMDAYKELEQRFQATIRQTGIAVGIYDIRSNHFDVFVRDEEYHFADGAEGVIAKGIVHPDDAEKYRSLFRRVAQGEASVSALVRFCWKQGSEYRWTHMVMAEVPDRDGKPFRAMMTQTDVTEQIRRERRYREEMMRRQALEGDVALSLSLNLTQDTLQEYIVNGERLSGSCGKSLSWAVEQGIAHLPEEKDREALSAFFDIERLKKAVHAGEATGSIEYLRRFADGELRWAECRVDIMENPETGDRMLFACVRDIHDVKVDEMAVTNVVEGLIDYIACLDVTTGKARFVRSPNKEVLPLELLDSYDFEAETLRAAKFLPEPEESRELVRCVAIKNLVAQLGHAQMYHFDFWFAVGDKRSRKEIRAFYIGSAKSMIVILQRDITDIYMEAEAKREVLRKALEDAKQASRAKSDFLSRMSHEIRTPMNAIIGLTALAAGRAEDSAYVADSLSKMNSAAHFLLGLINDVLDISRIERGKMQLDNAPHGMADFLEGIDVIVRARATEGGVRYTRVSKGELPAACMFDALKLKQVLVNILSNAVKFTPQDGSVEFVAEMQGTSEGWATLRFVIKDTGIGIAPDFLPRIFSAFEQENAGNTTHYVGTGLGLAISKSIVDLMGGTIDVKSEKGVGTVFFVSVTLPVVSLSEDDVPDDREEADFTGMRALLAEDNEINREIATAILEDKGFAVDPVADGLEAVEKFRASDAGTYDVVLMDIRMPFMDGFMATETIRAIEDSSGASAVPIVAMTANAFEEDVQRARAAGMDEYLTKPVEPSMVYKVLWNILRKKKR